MICRVLIIVTLLLSPNLSWAASYYVDCDNGSNANAGSGDAPWRTLSYAESQMAGGDTLFLRGAPTCGVHKGPLREIPSGSSGGGWTFIVGYPGEDAVIDNSTEVTGWALDSGNIYVADFTSSWLTPDGVNPQVGWVNVDRVWDSDHFPRGKTAKASMLQNTWYYDAAANDLYLWLWNDADPSGHSIWASDDANDKGNITIRPADAGWIYISDLTVQNSYHGIHPTLQTPGTHDIIVNNVIVRGSKDGIRTERNSTGVTIQNCSVFRNRGVGIQLNGNDGVISGTCIFENAIVSWGVWADFAIILMGNDHHVYNNDIEAHWQTGKGLMFEAWGTYGAGGTGTSHDNIVEYNRFRNLWSINIHISGGDTNYIRHNLFHEGDKAIYISRGGTGGSATEEQREAYFNYIYNNTFNNYDEAGIECASTLGYLHDNVVKNNIFSDSNSYHILDYSGQCFSGSGELDYNIYYTEHNNGWRSGSDSYNTLAAWTSGKGFDSNSGTTDPGFVDSGNSDFTIESDSGAIDNGEDLGSPHNLALHPDSTWPSGVSLFAQNADWEIGAYGYDAESPEPPVAGVPDVGTLGGPPTGGFSDDKPTGVMR